MQHFDSLEKRQLLSAGDIVKVGELIFLRDALITASEINGVLTINGSSNSDQISIGRDGKDLLIETPGHKLAIAPKAGDKNVFVTSIDGVQGGGKFSLTTIKKIVINSGNGSDLVTVSDKLNLPVEVIGGAGNDTISRGSGNDTLSGGKGNDVVFGNLGNDELHGNAGDDSLDSGRGYNSIFGDAGNDVRPKKNPGFDFRIDSIETRAYVGSTSAPLTDLADLFDGVSVVKRDNGEIVVESGFTPGEMILGLSWSEPKGRLGRYDIDVTATTYRRVTGGNQVLVPSSRWSSIAISESGPVNYFISGGSSTRKAFNLGKLGSGEYSVTVRSGDTVLGEYSFNNTSNFKGQRLDATDYMKYNATLPSIEELLRQNDTLLFGGTKDVTIEYDASGAIARVGYGMEE